VTWVFASWGALAEGKTKQDALRALRRRGSNAVRRQFLVDTD
jgi:hypothetical protein